MTLKIQIRWLIRRDFTEVLYNDFAACREPLSEEDLVALLRVRNIIGMVAELNGNIAGHNVYQIGSASIAILRLAVHPLFQRAGIGRAFIKRLAEAHCRKQLEAIVSERNDGAHFFLQKCGFRGVSVVRGEPDEYVFVRSLETADAKNDAAFISGVNR